MSQLYEKIRECTGFEWDEYNIKKNWEKHFVTPLECEQIFFNKPLLVLTDLKHSDIEMRFYALGRTDRRRMLFVVFTIRNLKIGVISARDMSRKERNFYEEQC